LESPIISTSLDQNWYVQGRVIPPSCTNEGCVLHLQAKFHSWAEEHFHLGKVSINPTVGIEFVTSMLIPVEEALIQDSLDPTEVEKCIDYLIMGKLSQPEDTLAFTTVNGLTILIHVAGISAMFGPVQACPNCQTQEAMKSIIAANGPIELDPLMELISAGKEH